MVGSVCVCMCVLARVWVRGGGRFNASLVFVTDARPKVVVVGGGGTWRI